MHCGAKHILLLQTQLYRISVGSTCSCETFVCLLIHFIFVLLQLLLYMLYSMMMYEAGQEGKIIFLQRRGRGV